MSELTDPPPLKFSQVYREEQKEIKTRRERQFYAREKDSDSSQDCVGLALSGGGIRSATFCLGFLQELNQLKLLRIFDYLSTVSGGGYVGGWWTAWLSRDEEVMRRKRNPRLDQKNVHHEASLVARIADGEDEMSKDLREQIRLGDKPTYRLLTQYTAGEQPDPTLLKELVGQLNAYIENSSDEASRLLEMVTAEPALEATLTATQKADLEKARDWKEGSDLLDQVTANPDLEATLEAAQKVKLEKAQRRIEGFRLLEMVTAEPDLEDTLTATQKADLEEARRRENDRRWDNRFRLEKAFPYELRNNFPPNEMIEPMRRNPDTEENSEGSLHAYRDPIHHLRLFANYLTPRKGMLSADTWRAVSVTARNLVLTWLILLPVLIAVMLLGQAYLLLNPVTGPAFVAGQPADLFSTMAPLIVLAGWSIVIAIGWLICNRESTSASDWLVQTVCLLALLALLASGISSIDSILTFIRQLKEAHWIILAIWGATTAIMMIVIWMLGIHKSEIAGDDPETLARWKRDVRRSRLSRAQARLLVTTAVVGIVLFVSWVCTHHRPTQWFNYSNLPIALLPLISIAGSVFTALRATPSTSGDRAALREPNFISRMIFAITPPMVLVMLAASAGVVANRLLRALIKLPLSTAVTNTVPTPPTLLYVAAVLFIGLCMALAVYEMKDVKWSAILEPSLSAALFIGMVMVNVSWIGQVLVYSVLQGRGGGQLGIVVLAVSLAMAVVITIFVLVRVLPRRDWKGKLLARLEDAGKDLDGIRGERTRAIVKGIQGSFNLVFALTLIASLTAIGWIIGQAIFAKMAGDEPTPGGRFGALILSFVSIAGGVIMFRFCLRRIPSQQRANFDLKWLNGKSFANRPEGRWLLAALCLVVPVGFMCLAHALHRGPAYRGGGQWLLILFPLTLAALLGFMIFLRSLVIEKFGDEWPAPDSWSKKFFDWAFDRIPVARKHDRRALQLLALLAIGISMLADPMSSSIASSDMTIGKLRGANLILMSVMLLISLPVFGAAVFQLRPAIKVNRRFQRDWPYSNTFLWILASTIIVLALAAGSLLPAWLLQIGEVPLNGGLTPILPPGATLCFLLVLFETFWGEGENRRSLWLITLAYAGFATIFFMGLATPSPGLHYWKVVLGLLSAVIVWVVALGWMVDPNAVSMHQFYKGRLVRAYLGASNVRRREHGNKEITETVAGDDLLLKSLHNCERGGPYHLINTTLNLVGGRDLATAQRSASSFILSQKHCGSSRTHYRPTDEYMSGQLSLGTAVAASGAAVSPNMGSKKPTAALAMLMTLLNVRLGYWAPTPNRETWQSSQPRLWPFYLLREFLSQTNDVANYCYLTDGGHFDNTGLYPLIERGCRYIVLVDCGADPKPACFQDLGEAIRRCRIDFGAEIDLSLDSLLEKDANHCFMFGSIRFSKEHLKALGKWPGGADDDDNRDGALDGTIIYIKPAVVPSVTADVRQYSLENEFFPQQTTANQWFDEAQFESYRRLGQFCATKVFNTDAVRDLGKVVRLSAQDIETLFIELENASKK